MNPIKSLGLLGVAGLMLIVPAIAAAGGAKPAGLSLTPVSDAALTAPVHNTYGKVTSLVGSVLTLDAKGRALTFVVDENTGVLARGAGRATRKAGGSLPIIALVRPGDLVRVGYRVVDGVARAVEVQISGRHTVTVQ